MSTPDSIHFLTMTELAGLIRSRAVSPVEIVAAQLDRIEEFDGALRAYALVMPESARAQARAAEAELDAGYCRGPLHGVPIAIKDVFHVAGVPMQGGLKRWSGQVPDADAVVVGRLKDAGAILLGKLHTTEGAMDGYHRDFPIPRNPWGAHRWPGVSSSGSGVAVAAGMCYAALGTDTGGSTRIPCAANGIVGLKPTHGLLSTKGLLPLSSSFDSVGLLVRSVADAAALLQALAPTRVWAPDTEGLRIGYDDRLCSEGVQPCVSDAVWQALQVLRDQGAQLVPASLPAPDEASRLWYVIAAREAAVAHEYASHCCAGDYGDGFRHFLEQGQAISAAKYDEAQQRRMQWIARTAECFNQFDLFACPGLPGEAFDYDPQDAYRGPNRATGSSDGIPAAFMAAMNRLVLPFSLNGYPTLSVPCGISPAGMPIGLQLVGRAHAEPMLLHCGMAFQSQAAWHLRHPPGLQ